MGFQSTELYLYNNGTYFGITKRKNKKPKKKQLANRRLGGWKVKREDKDDFVISALICSLAIRNTSTWSKWCSCFKETKETSLELTCQYLFRIYLSTALIRLKSKTSDTERETGLKLPKPQWHSTFFKNETNPTSWLHMIIHTGEYLPFTVSKLTPLVFFIFEVYFWTIM